MLLVVIVNIDITVSHIIGTHLIGQLKLHSSKLQVVTLRLNQIKRFICILHSLSTVCFPLSVHFNFIILLQTIVSCYVKNIKNYVYFSQQKKKHLTYNVDILINIFKPIKKKQPHIHELNLITLNTNDTR